MLAPQKAVGTEQTGRVLAQTGMQALMLAAQKVGPFSEQGKVLLDVIAKLAKTFGKSENQDKQLMPAQIQQMLAASKSPAMPGAVAGAIKPPAAAAA
jgi:hypothetical protein